MSSRSRRRRGLDTIEWIYDAYGEDVNPLATDEGLGEMRRLGALHGMAIESVCADWFMDYPLVGVDASTAQPRWRRLGWLMERGALLGINRIVVPFVDAAAIRNDSDASAVVIGINSLGAAIDRTGVELHLETALSAADFAALLARLGHPRVKVNYDSGNSASLGYRPQQEFAAYGPRVGSVHLKDRRRGAGTVPLAAVIPTSRRCSLRWPRTAIAAISFCRPRAASTAMNSRGRARTCTRRGR